MKRFLLLVALCMILPFTGCKNNGSLSVKEVIDGDSLRLANGKEVRLLGIDAPEYNHPGGDMARDFLEKLVLNKGIRLVSDTEDRDKYGRLLRYVYAGDTFVNGEMLAKGYAFTMLYSSSQEYKNKLLALENEARRAKHGLWAFYPGTETVSWQDAPAYIGRRATVEGKVVRSYNSGKACFLNFHEDFKTHFSRVIFSQDFSKFPSPPEKLYLNKNVRVTGLVKLYKGAPEIVVTGPEQIKVVD